MTSTCLTNIIWEIWPKLKSFLKFSNATARGNSGSFFWRPTLSSDEENRHDSLHRGMTDNLRDPRLDGDR